MAGRLTRSSSPREVPALVDAGVVARPWACPAHIVVVEAGVEHDDGERQHVARVCAGGGSAPRACQPGPAGRRAPPTPPRTHRGLEDAGLHRQ